MLSIENERYNYNSAKKTCAGIGEMNKSPLILDQYSLIDSLKEPGGLCEQIM